MSEILQANIFFFIASLATVLFTVMLCIALYHLIKILRMVRSITERIEAGSETIAEDMAAARDYFKEGSFFSHLISIFLSAKGFSFGKKRSRKSKNSKKRSSQDEEE